MELHQFAEATGGQSITLGWDAVLAIDSCQANELWFQDYLLRGPGSPAVHLRCLIPSGEDPDLYTVLDTTAGPPDVSFPEGLTSSQCQLEMFLVGGAVVTVDAGEIAHAIQLRPDAALISGPVDLAVTSGDTDVVGEVSLDLQSGAYTPSVDGLQPGSIVATEVGQAIQTYFAAYETRFTLGTVKTAGVDPGLQPTFFDVVVQRSDSSDDACVLLLIQTNGQRGSTWPLGPYPITQGSSATLILSNRVIFSEVLPPKLEQEFAAQNLTMTFAGDDSSGYFVSLATAGPLVNTGEMQSMVWSGGSTHTAYSCAGKTDTDAVTVDIDLRGVTVRPNAGEIAVEWTQRWDQNFAVETCTWKTPCESNAWGENPGTVTASYAGGAAPSCDPDTNLVSFAISGSPKVTAPTESSWQQFWQGFDWNDATSGLMEPITNATAALFKTVVIPDIDTFSLANLLFPNDHVLRFAGGTLPCDLVIPATMQPPLAVTPEKATVQVGSTQQMAASLGGQLVSAVTWSATLGSIGDDGTYTAPETATGLAVITAKDRSDQTRVGRALLLVEEPIQQGELVVRPPSVIVTPGHSFSFLVCDGDQPATSATCSVPPGEGTAAEGMSAGEWVYTAPASVGAPYDVTLTFQTSAATGTAVVHLLPSQQVTIDPPAIAVAPVYHQPLTASTDVDGWVMSPPGLGEIVPDDDDSTKATFVAPESIVPGSQVDVVAYSLTRAAGVGICSIRLAYNPPVTLSVSPNPAKLGDVVTFSATVPAGATGTIGIYDKQNVSPDDGHGYGKPDEDGHITITNTRLFAPGSYTLYADYSADATYPPGDSPTVPFTCENQTRVTVQASPNPAKAGEAITFTGTVPTGATGSIAIYDGEHQSPDNGHGTATVGVEGDAVVQNTRSFSAGTYQVWAWYESKCGLPSSGSDPITLTVED